MDPRPAASRAPDPDAVEFIRFCYRRRRVGWPELYDEMCAVASRGLFRGYGTDELGDIGIGFALFDMPALAALANRIVAEEKALRRPMTVVITDEPAPPIAEPTPATEPIPPVTQPVYATIERQPEPEPVRRFSPPVIPATA